MTKGLANQNTNHYYDGTIDKPKTKKSLAGLKFKKCKRKRNDKSNKR